MTRRALLPWYNAFSFLQTYAAIDNWAPDKGMHFGDNVLDHWLMSRLQTLKSNIAAEMEAYKLYNVVPELFAFIEDLTNWYIRLNRSRFWGEQVTADKISAYSTLYTVLMELSLVMAPFTPFLSEYLYRALTGLTGKTPHPHSVHLCDYPEAEDSYVKPGLEEAVDRMQQVILLGRQKREDVKIGLRTPLSKLTVVHRDENLLKEMQSLESYIRDELNIRQIEYSADEAAFIELVAKPNFPLLGKRLGKRMKEFQQAINAMDAQAIADLQASGSVVLLGESFDLEEIQVLQQARTGTNTVSNSRIAVDIDCELTPELIRGGYAREMVNRIQRARKDQGFHVSDRIEVVYNAQDELARAVAEHDAYIMFETLALSFESGDQVAGTVAEIDGMTFAFDITKAVKPSAD
jgi:isoleucyl-tRNA synthetase